MPGTDSGYGPTRSSSPPPLSVALSRLLAVLSVPRVLLLVLLAAVPPSRRQYSAVPGWGVPDASCRVQTVLCGSFSWVVLVVATSRYCVQSRKHDDLSPAVTVRYEGVSNLHKPFQTYALSFRDTHATAVSAYTPNQIQGTAFLVQIVLKLRFPVFDFGVCSRHTLRLFPWTLHA
eukprot:861494-Rhodomonas_salina.2